MVTYLADKWSVSNDSNLLMDTVHWRCLVGKARQASSFPIQNFVSKWISGDTAAGEVMVYHKQRDSSACPHCQRENEDLVSCSCTFLPKSVQNAEEIPSKQRGHPIFVY